MEELTNPLSDFDKRIKSNHDRNELKEMTDLEKYKKESVIFFNTEIDNNELTILKKQIEVETLIGEITSLKNENKSNKTKIKLVENNESIEILSFD